MATKDQDKNKGKSKRATSGDGAKKSTFSAKGRKSFDDKPPSGAGRKTSYAERMSSGTGNKPDKDFGGEKKRATPKDEKPKTGSTRRRPMADGTERKSMEERKAARPKVSRPRSDEDERPMRKPLADRGDAERPTRKPFAGSENDRSERPTEKSDRGEERPKRTKVYEEFTNKSDRKPAEKTKFFRDNRRPASEGTRPTAGDGEKRPYRKREDDSTTGSKRINSRGEEVKPYRDRRDGDDDKRTTSGRTALRDGKFQGRYGADKKKSFAKSSTRTTGNTRLNKYIANSGICSRREADELISSGLIEVNGEAVTEMGYQVKEGDKVTYAGERLNPEKPVYILMNKPKDFITTVKDPEGRRTVMSLLRGIGEARVFPVGRLDRHTTGLLLLTNDGNLAKKLTHPTHGVKKLYHVYLDKPLKAADMRTLLEGVNLEDGPMKADVLSYVGDGKDKKEVGIEIHSGKNRVVRRLFDHLGYEVMKLDRVLFAGLSKKDLPRGKWRHLTPQELITLKMFK